MEESKIPTYSDFKIQKYKEFGRVLSDDELAIKFAKMHVIACEKAHRKFLEKRDYAEQLIYPNTYPLENIK